MLETEYRNADSGLRNGSVEHDRTDTRLDVFPAFHNIAGRKILVAGGGSEAAAKLRLLSMTNARIVAVAPEFSAEMEAAARSNSNIELMEREFEESDVEKAVLVFSATGAPESDRSVSRAAKLHGVPFNAVDRPEMCDFYTPAIVNRAPVVIGISSTGIGPVLTQRIRARIEGLLPLNIGALAQLAQEFRSTVAQVITSGRARRQFWSRFFNGAVSTFALAGRLNRARSEAQRLLNGKNRQEGFVWLVGAGPGAEDLLTLRAQRTLQEADIIIYDRLVPESVVAMGRRDAERICVGKAKGMHSYTQSEINGLLVSEASSGKRVVRLKSGDPMIFGRAGEEIDALRNSGIGYEIVPGVSAAQAAAASVEIPLTMRGVASNLVFATGHDFNGETMPGWAGLTLSGTTVAVYMGKSVAAKVSKCLIDAGLEAQTPVVAVANASRKNETAYSGVVADMPSFAENTSETGPVLFVIGEVVAKASMEHALALNQFQNSLDSGTDLPRIAA